MPILNYKYEIFPTRPQRYHIIKIFKQVKAQWNYACKTRKKLLRTFNSGQDQFEHLINILLSQEKNNKQAVRKNAIRKFSEKYLIENSEQAAELYDIKNIFGYAFGDDFGIDHLDISFLTETLKRQYAEETGHRDQEKQAYREKVAEIEKENETREKKKKIPKFRPPAQKVRTCFLKAVNRHAGYAANRYVKKSFKNPKGTNMAVVIDAVSGSANSYKWKTATEPSAEQRKNGAKGKPNFKRRIDSFSYQFQGKKEDLILTTKAGKKQVVLKSLLPGSNRITMAYHREIPTEGKIKNISVKHEAGHYFVVFSADIPERDHAIVPIKQGWMAGIDPGMSTVLTIGLVNANTGEVASLSLNYAFMDKFQEKLATLQQKADNQEGPKRKLTEAEIQEKMGAFEASQAVLQMRPETKEKALAEHRKKLELKQVWRNSDRKPSKRWLQTKWEIGKLHYRVKNQRHDLHHKISKMLAQGCDVVAIGHWEPVRKVTYRQQRKELKQKVRLGVPGAKEELKALEDDPAKGGRKGIKKQRRKGRDIAIATLRAFVKEKADRSGIEAHVRADESGTTMTCCLCEQKTGPKKDLTIRKWTCDKCKVTHHRDVNSAFGILMKTLKNKGAAQSAALVREHLVILADGHEVGGQSGNFSGTPANRDCRIQNDSNFQLQLPFFSVAEENEFLPNLWDVEGLRVFNDLKNMEIIAATTMQETPEKSEKEAKST